MKKKRISYQATPEFHLLNEVTPIDALVPRIERFSDMKEHLDDVRTMQKEITTLAKFSDATGFTRDRHMQRVCRIPSSVWSAVLEVFPDAGQNKDLFYALLAGPLKDYDLRNKVSLT
jgi:hypothetical protein